MRWLRRGGFWENPDLVMWAWICMPLLRDLEALHSAKSLEYAVGVRERSQLWNKLRTALEFSLLMLVGDWIEMELLRSEKRRF